MRTIKAVSIIVAGLALSATVLNAQSANINATATVLSPITVSGTNPLAFGNVTPGVAKTIAASAATAGLFTVAAANSTPIAVTFTLPATLTGPGAPMPMSAWTGLWNQANNQGAATVFTPSAVPLNQTTSAGGAFFVWVGGTVTPAAVQTAGGYTGVITMNVVYQ